MEGYLNMSRALRIEYHGALYHVTSRGDRREDIYEDDIDRKVFMTLFEEVCENYNWDCHAYCLMSNHYHLLIETPGANLSKGMRQLNGVYSQKYNLRHKKVGHVFQGRYHAILVEKEKYLLELSRYIVLNPVRANMVRKPDEWSWSSYNSVIHNGHVGDWLNCDWLLSCFNTNRDIAVKLYIEFVANGVETASPFNEVKNQVFLGNDSFIERGLAIVDESKKSAEVPRRQKRSLGLSLECYQKNHSSRNEAIVESYKSGRYTMKEIGSYFGLSYSMVSRIVKDSKLKT